MRMRVSLATLALAGWTVSGTAQFADLPAVTIAVTITDKSGDPVTPQLTAANFRVVEDGREQKGFSVTPGPGSVSISVVLDSLDALIGTQHRLAERAVERLAASLTPEDEISLVMYRQPARAFTPVVPWTRGGRWPKIDWTIWHTLPFSDFLNGVRRALFMMDTTAHPRRAVLAIAGMDELASGWSLSKYVATQRQSETAIYGFQTEDLSRPAPREEPGGFSSSSGRMVTFEDLLRDGGGRTFAVKTPEQAERSADRLLDELRNQYLVRYLSSKPFDGNTRKLKVELKNTKDLKIRHRLGYLAKPPRT